MQVKQMQDGAKVATCMFAQQAPEGALISSGVVVEQGESCLYVKVNCRDRRGLLGDIILALKAMPLEVCMILCVVWHSSGATAS